MRLNKTERESLRKRVEIVIPQMKKSKNVNHFQKEGYRCGCSATKNSGDNFTKNRNFDDKWPKNRFLLQKNSQKINFLFILN